MGHHYSGIRKYILFSILSTLTCKSSFNLGWCSLVDDIIDTRVVRLVSEHRPGPATVEISLSRVHSPTAPTLVYA